MMRTCIDRECGAPFEPRHPRQRRCERCEPAFAGRQAHYRSPSWRRNRQRVQGACAYCGATRNVHRHHLRAVEDGGTDDPSNLLLLCGRDHAAYEADVRYGRSTDLRRFVERHAQRRDS